MSSYVVVDSAVRMKCFAACKKTEVGQREEDGQGRGPCGAAQRGRR